MLVHPKKECVKWTILFAGLAAVSCPFVFAANPAPVMRIHDLKEMSIFAQEAFKLNLESYRTGAIVTPDVLYQWSCRIRDVEVSTGDAKAIELAKQNHAERMAVLAKAVKGRVEANEGLPADVVAARYYVLEAKMAAGNPN